MKTILTLAAVLIASIAQADTIGTLRWDPDIIAGDALNPTTFYGEGFDIAAVDTPAGYAYASGAVWGDRFSFALGAQRQQFDGYFRPMYVNVVCRFDVVADAPFRYLTSLVGEVEAEHNILWNWTDREQLFHSAIEPVSVFEGTLEADHEYRLMMMITLDGYTGTTATSVHQLHIVPEPGAWVLMISALGGALLIWVWRRNDY